MTSSTAEKNERDKGGGFIPPDWKSHVGKTLISLALTGLASIMVLSGRFILNEGPKAQALVSTWTATANQERAQTKRLQDLMTSVKETSQRRLERSTRIAGYLESHKSRPDLDALSELLHKNADEAADDAGLLSGYTSETTGLPTSFHDSLHAYSQSELDFCRTLDEALAAARKNPKTAMDKVLELRSRTTNTIYTGSQLNSSMQDVLQVLQARAQKTTDFAQAAKAQAEYEEFWVSRAWRFFFLSTLTFLVLATLLLLDWLPRKANKKG